GLRINRISRVAEVCNRLGRRQQVEQQLKALSRRFGQQEIDASKISAGSIEAVDETDPHWVSGLHKHNWDRLGRRFGGKRTICTLQYSEHRYLAANQFGYQRRYLIISTPCPTVFDHGILVLDVTGLLQASAKVSEILAIRFERCEVKKSDPRHRWLLRARRVR